MTKLRSISFLLFLFVVWCVHTDLHTAAAQAPMSPNRAYPMREPPKVALEADEAQPAPAATRQGLKQPCQTAAQCTLDGNNWTRFVYQSLQSGNWDVYASTLGDSGSAGVQITANSASDTMPRLRPRAEQVVFVSTRDGNSEIYTMNVGGSDPRRLTDNEGVDTMPAWSPDGQKIVFATNRDGNYELYRMDANGGNPARLTDDAQSDFYPAWSPDGTRIAWVRAFDQAHGAIYVATVGAAGGLAGAAQVSASLAFVNHLAWSPSGDRLAFDYDANGDGWLDIGIMDATGSNLTTLLTATTTIDYWVGSWTPKADLLLTRVQYVDEDGDWLILGSHVVCTKVDSGCPANYALGNLSFSPDAQSMDSFQPVSQVNPLPTYSRAQGFELTWTGSDLGPAGIYDVQIQTRASGSAAWSTWESFEAGLNWHIFSGPPGGLAYFRSLSRDCAENEQTPAEGNGDAFTRLFAWMISGTVRDGRGHPIPAATLQLTPGAMQAPSSDPAGTYTAYLTDDGSYTLQVSASGHGSLPATVLAVRGDQANAYSLPPEDDQVKNGNFEYTGDSLKYWQTAGSAPQAVSASHSGQKSARLSLNCPEPCLTAAEQPGPAGDDPATELMVDSSGKVYLFNQAGQYYTRSAPGTWSALQTPSAASGFEQATADLDPQGTLHLVGENDSGYFYLKSTDGQIWSTPEGLSFTPYYWEGDSQGSVHFVYQCLAPNCTQAEGWYEIQRTAAGAWSEPVLIANAAYAWMRVKLAPDGSLVIFHEEYASDRYYWLEYRLKTDRSLTTANRLPSISPLQLAFDDQGTLHVLGVYSNELKTSGDLAYATLSADGAWSYPTLLPGGLRDVRMAVSAGGEVAFTAPYGAYNTNYYLILKAAHESQFSRTIVPTAQWDTATLPLLVFDDSGDLHLALRDNSNLNYRKRLHSTLSGLAQLSQAITIPAGLHRPTLSYWVKASGLNGESQASVELRHGDQSETLLSTQASADWTQYWADLSAYAGQVVTLTFNLDQAAGEEYGMLWVDDVSMGSWLTPVVSEVDPASLADYNGETITIRGDNFLNGASARLGEYTLENVAYVDEHTLQATLPDGILPGDYTAWVTNPGGQSGALAQGIRLGGSLRLPLIEMKLYYR